MIADDFLRYMGAEREASPLTVKTYRDAIDDYLVFLGKLEGDIKLEDADSDVVREGYELNLPVRTAAGDGGHVSLLSVDAPNVIVETVKAAEDGSSDWILRLYECKRADTDAVLTLNVPAKCVQLCDMLENPLETLDAADGNVKLHFHTFEVKTVRVKR